MPHLGILALVSLAICDCPADGDSTPHSSQCYEDPDSGATVTLNKNFFINIVSNSGGGAVYCPTLIATECCFRNCTGDMGGAIYTNSDGSSCTRLVGESCSAGTAGFLYFYGSRSCAELQIFGCLARTGAGAGYYYHSGSTSTSNFTRCYANAYCGAIQLNAEQDDRCPFSGCFFFNCSSLSPTVGGILADCSLVVVTTSIFLDCDKGPGTCRKEAELCFERCAFERSEFLAPPGAYYVKPNVSKCLFSDAISPQVVDLGGNMAQVRASSGIIDLVVVAEACDYFERVLNFDTPSDHIHLSDGAMNTDAARAGGVPSLNAATHNGEVGHKRSALLESSAAFVSITTSRSPYKIRRTIIAVWGLLLLWA